jgi:ubiquinone/menaquinone biosynthesis C-methylase UbiE
MKLNYNFLAQEYAKHRQVQPEVLKNLMETGLLSSASRVLDVGCGTGNYTVALEKALGCTCWGIEPSEQMLVRAKERTQSAQFKLGKAESLDYPDTSFDLVFSVDVIHHVVDRAAHYREAYRVLKQGGKVCTVTDSESIIQRRQPLTIYFPENVEVELQRYLRMNDLKAMMAEAGFRDIEEHEVEFPYSLADSQIYRDKAFSSLHLISPDAFERGIQRMEEDLKKGPIPCVSRYVLLWGTK